MVPRARDDLLIDEAMFHEWVQVLRSRDPLFGHPGSQGKFAAREQRQREAALLGICTAESAELLRAWHSWAAQVATMVVNTVVTRAAVATRAESAQVTPPQKSNEESSR